MKFKQYPKKTRAAYASSLTLFVAALGSALTAFFLKQYNLALLFVVSAAFFTVAVRGVINEMELIEEEMENEEG